MRNIYEIVCASVLEDEQQEEVDPSELRSFSTDELINLPPMIQKERLEDVNISPQVDKQKQQEARQALSEYEERLTDIPGQSRLGGTHDQADREQNSKEQTLSSSTCTQRGHP